MKLFKNSRNLYNPSQGYLLELSLNRGKKSLQPRQSNNFKAFLATNSYNPYITRFLGVFEVIKRQVYYIEFG
ncbi:hypothetical protein D4Z78_10470 [Okeania hirsuta]|nr:hypothetical protein D4Z78_10470 [Okeania hirsuta]